MTPIESPATQRPMVPMTLLGSNLIKRKKDVAIKTKNAKTPARPNNLAKAIPSKIEIKPRTYSPIFFIFVKTLDMVIPP